MSIILESALETTHSIILFFEHVDIWSSTSTQTECKYCICIRNQVLSIRQSYHHWCACKIKKTYLLYWLTLLLRDPHSTLFELRKSEKSPFCRELLRKAHDYLIIWKCIVVLNTYIKLVNTYLCFTFLYGLIVIKGSYRPKDKYDKYRCNYKNITRIYSHVIHSRFQPTCIFNSFIFFFWWFLTHNIYFVIQNHIKCIKIYFESMCI